MLVYTFIVYTAVFKWQPTEVVTFVHLSTQNSPKYSLFFSPEELILKGFRRKVAHDHLFSAKHHPINAGNVPNCHSESVISVMFMSNRYSTLFTAAHSTETDPCVTFPIP